MPVGGADESEISKGWDDVGRQKGVQESGRDIVEGKVGEIGKIDILRLFELEIRDLKLPQVYREGEENQLQGRTVGGKSWLTAGDHRNQRFEGPLRDECCREMRGSRENLEPLSIFILLLLRFLQIPGLPVLLPANH